MWKMNKENKILGTSVLTQNKQNIINTMCLWSGTDLDNICCFYV